MTNQDTYTSRDEMYFITLKTSHEIRHNELLANIFDDREYSDILVKALIYLIDRFKLNLYGFVILSDQVHLILGTTETEIHEKIEILKRVSAREIMLLIGKKLNNMDEVRSRKLSELRKVFGSYLNQDETILWGKNEKFLQLQRFQRQEHVIPITSEELLVHLSDKNRNYLQLGADAFTKVMMDRI